MVYMQLSDFCMWLFVNLKRRWLYDDWLGGTLFLKDQMVFHFKSYLSVELWSSLSYVSVAGCLHDGKPTYLFESLQPNVNFLIVCTYCIAETYHRSVYIFIIVF
jgi:hypothetical protein